MANAVNQHGTSRRLTDPRWLVVLREQGRNQPWLAQRTGVSVFTVYAYRQGQRPTPQAWLEKAADALGVPASLLADTEDAA